jgi:hypothetical protein
LQRGRAKLGYPNAGTVAQGPIRIIVDLRDQAVLNLMCAAGFEAWVCNGWQDSRKRCSGTLTSGKSKGSADQ